MVIYKNHVFMYKNTHLPVKNTVVDKYFDIYL